MKKVIILPAIVLMVLFVGCKESKKEDKSKRHRTTEVSESDLQKMATPTPTPLPEDLKKVEYFDNGGNDKSSVSEYEDGKLKYFFEYSHGDKDAEYQTIYTYEDDLLVKEEVIYNGSMSNVNFDERNRGYTLYTYNENNLVCKELTYNENDTLVKEVDYLYDEFGYIMTTVIENGQKRVTMTAPNGDDTYLEIYDENGNLIDQHNYEYEFDDLGNKTKFTIIINGEVEREYLYEYDKSGNETKSTEYWYGKLSTEVITEYAPDYSWKSTTLISYDDEGNACSSRYFYRAYNENGQEIEFWYSDSKDMEPEEDIFHTYDKNGNMLSMVDGDYTTIYKYDDQGRLLEEDAFFRDELRYYYSYSYEDS